MVIREVLEKSDGIYISTLGIGEGSLGKMNSEYKGLWNKIDQNIVNKFNK